MAASAQLPQHSCLSTMKCSIPLPSPLLVVLMLVLWFSQHAVGPAAVVVAVVPAAVVVAVVPAAAVVVAVVPAAVVVAVVPAAAVVVAVVPAAVVVAVVPAAVVVVVGPYGCCGSGGCVLWVHKSTVPIITTMAAC